MINELYTKNPSKFLDVVIETYCEIFPNMSLFAKEKSIEFFLGDLVETDCTILNLWGSDFPSMKNKEEFLKKQLKTYRLEKVIEVVINLICECLENNGWMSSILKVFKQKLCLLCPNNIKDIDEITMVDVETFIFEKATL